MFESTAFKRGFIAFIVLAVLASVGLGFLYIKSVDELKAEAAEKAAAVSKAQKELDEIKLEYLKKFNKEVSDDVGKDYAMIQSNMRFIEDTFKPIFKWKSLGEYTKARENLIKEIGENNDFVRDFALDYEHELQSDTADGKEVEYKLKSGYKRFDIYPSTDNSYSYYVLIDYYNYRTKKQANKQAFNSRYMVLRIDMSDVKEVEHIECYAADNINKSKDSEYL